MNSLCGREFELYNICSTEYNNALINKDIDNYFNDIINKPIISIDTKMNKLNGGFNKFYTDYIEHNLIFIVVLIGIVIFLIIRHYIKDFDTFETEIDNNIKSKNILHKKHQNDKIKSEQFESEKLKLINYKNELDKEKQQILSIIDELSNINDYENNRNNDYVYLNNNINTLQTDEYNNQNFEQQNQNLKINTKIDNFNIAQYDNDDNMSNYYNVNKTQDDKTNLIDGLYIEPPFM